MWPKTQGGRSPGCDLCPRWFHNFCVGNNTGAPAKKLWSSKCRYMSHTAVWTNYYVMTLFPVQGCS